MAGLVGFTAGFCSETPSKVEKDCFFFRAWSQGGASLTLAAVAALGTGAGDSVTGSVVSDVAGEDLVDSLTGDGGLAGRLGFSAGLVAGSSETLVRPGFLLGPASFTLNGSTD